MAEVFGGGICFIFFFGEFFRFFFFFSPPRFKRIFGFFFLRIGGKIFLAKPPQLLLFWLFLEKAREIFFFPRQVVIFFLGMGEKFIFQKREKIRERPKEQKKGEKNGVVY